MRRTLMATNGHAKLRPIGEVADLVYGESAKQGEGLFPVITADVDRCTTPEEVVAYAKKRGLAMVDYRFTDLFGRWHHFTMPIHYLTEDVFVEGLGFDGSSIRAFQDIHESDM